MSLMRTGPWILAALLSGGCENLPDLGSVLVVPTAEDVLSTQTIDAGLREALEVGSQRAVSTLGRTDGFLASQFRIPLPDELVEVEAVADRFGLGATFDDLEVRLNRAAEAAAPKARALFVDAIRALTFDDVLAIYNGGDDAATRYLKRTTAERLRAEMRPIVDESLAGVGAAVAFETLAEQYNRLPLVTPVDADITSHVLDHASEALFVRLAREEQAIRNNPARRTTRLLQQVFG